MVSVVSLIDSHSLVQPADSMSFLLFCTTLFQFSLSHACLSPSCIKAPITQSVLCFILPSFHFPPPCFLNFWLLYLPRWFLLVHLLHMPKLFQHTLFIYLIFHMLPHLSRTLSFLAWSTLLIPYTVLWQLIFSTSALFYSFHLGLKTYTHTTPLRLSVHIWYYLSLPAYGHTGKKSSLMRLFHG